MTLDTFQLGEPVEHRGILVTPLFPRHDPVTAYITLDEALPRGFQVSETSVVVRAVRAEQRTVLVGTQEVVRALGAWRRVDRAHGIASKGAVDTHKEFGLLEVREEDTQRPDHPSHRRGPREVAVASMEPHFPCRQEELEVSRSEIAYATWSEPVAEDPKRIQVLASCRVGATSPAEMCVEALKELLSGHAFLKTIYAIESINGT